MPAMGMFDLSTRENERWAVYCLGPMKFDLALPLAIR